MAESFPQANNTRLTFHRKPEQERSRMPFQPKDKGLDLPGKAVAEMIAEETPLEVKKLPARKKSRADRLRDRGLISDKQAEKLARE